MPILAAFSVAVFSLFAPAGPKLTLHIPSSAADAPFPAKVILYLSRKVGEPRFGPDWYAPEPMFSLDVDGIEPGKELVLDFGKAVAFPKPLALIDPGQWRAQVVVDRNLYQTRAPGSSPGNLYSKTQTIELRADSPADIALDCDQVVPQPTFKESDRVKEFKVQSKLLSDFYGKPIYIMGAVGLPESYSSGSKRYPVFYEIPGYGGTHYEAQTIRAFRTKTGTAEMIHIILDPDCPTGHCVFADSANNGPWGKALTTEFLPAVDQAFRTIANSSGRLVGGHSSGGWSSLWLQVTYPDLFGACYSSSPDPVDFRDFCGVNLYKDSNMFVDDKGKERPILRFENGKTLAYRLLNAMEQPIRGEQNQSFDAVFSPKGPDGKYMRLHNQITGAIDKKVVEYWKRYDIGMTLRNNWKELGPKLKGKIHILMGDKDTFYLEGATRYLQADLKSLGSDAWIKLVPGNHFTLFTPPVVKEWQGMMEKSALLAK
ncbi:MAG: hypothetical protein JST40_01240 [Armatimonadetes bacterium]|nr:hypothetical protein [Armatimonadota bacterium]